ncbi:unnamed protein product [Cyprideis torosa]|uniref:Sorbitol dehydrogenase n=1 Tax=Cyprideis torosa TaxID=163714 RepID=A0A7R8WUE0_9CRUS|nr:unnamed protein product [Cyprideis torosa]CAG0906513.1 unnamed protein product [Cyprideis torosa]
MLSPYVVEVLIEVARVGICGSDVNWGYRPDKVISAPMVLGHETSGIVKRLGKKVTSVSVGDRVAIEPGLPCRRCRICLKGRYNLCQKIRFCATPPVNGTLCRYFIWDEDFCHKLPDDMSLDEGALLEPLSVAIHACRRGNVAIGSKVLVLGAGPIGLLCMMTAKSMGATDVVITDIDESRLSMAKGFGASCAINVLRNAEEVPQLIRNSFHGEGPDVTIECSGAQQSVLLGIEVG